MKISKDGGNVWIHRKSPNEFRLNPATKKPKILGQYTKGQVPKGQRTKCTKDQVPK